MEIPVFQNQHITPEEIDKKLACCFFSCSFAFRAVQNPYFVDFVNTLVQYNGNYRLPNRHTLADAILNSVYREIRFKKRPLLKDTDSVMMLDGWKNTSCNRKYMVYTLRTIKTPQTYLCFRDISLETEHAHIQAVNIKNAIDLAKTEYNSTVYAIVSDNDIKMTSAIEIVQNTPDLHIIQSTCSSHSANLLIKKFIDDDFMERVKQVARVFSAPRYDALLRDIFGGTKVTNFPETRFCYYRDTCRSIRDNYDHLLTISIDIEDAEVRESVINILQARDFIVNINYVIDHLDPICKLINKCQESNCNVADSTELWLSLVLPTDMYDYWVNQRQNKAIYPVGYAANMLHHLYKGLLLNRTQKTKARNFIKANFNRNVLNEYDHYIDNMRDYENFAENCASPITFWTFVTLQLENLGPCAIKLMIIPASTALLEGLFSSWTYIHNEYRNRLKNEKSAKLLDMYYHLKHYNGIRVDER